MGGLVWLASYPKSGNTWTRNFLHNLLNRNEGTHDINKMQQKTAWDSSYHWYKPFLDKKPDEGSTAEIAAARMQANQNMADAAGDGLLFVKTHQAMLADHDGIPTINAKVTAGAVYIIRNPLDVVISYSHHLGFSIDETIAFMGTQGRVISASDTMVYDLQGSWSEHVFSWTKKSNPALYIMRYEDMINFTEKTFTGLTNFLQIECEAQDIRNAIQASSFEKLQKMEIESGFREKPDTAKTFFRKGEVDQWKTELSDSQIKQVIADHREQMERFGYLPENYK